MARRSKGRRTFRPSVLMGLWLALAMLAAGLLHNCRRQPQEQPEPISTTDQLVIRAIDVGQGDSFLITTPANKSVLIDAGPPEAADAVVAALRRANVQQLDLVVATHPHADHIGGMRHVLDAVKVKTFLDSGQPYSTRTFTTMLEKIKQQGLRFITAEDGQEFELDAGIKLHVLNPLKPFMKASETQGSALNANSIVIRLTYEAFSMLFTGDMEQETERKILAENADVSAKILKVAHHGSRYSSTIAFLKQVNPEVAIISCGASNEYGHPAQRTLDRLKPMVRDIYRTDLQGQITITSNGSSYRIESQHPAQGDLWVGRTPRRDDSDRQSTRGMGTPRE